MITLEQAKEYLSELGITPPDLIINAWLASFSDISRCMTENGYPMATQMLILSYLVALYGLSSGNRYISSQTAPSGASRSFRYAELRDIYRGQLGMLRMLDKAGCANGLIPPEPGAKGAALFIGRGGCYHE